MASKPSKERRLRILLGLAALKASSSMGAMSAANLYVTRVTPDDSCGEFDSDLYDRIYSGVVHLKDFTTGRRFKVHVGEVSFRRPTTAIFPALSGGNIECREIRWGSISVL